MFANLSDRLGQALRSVRGKGRLSDENIKDAVRQVRMALLEADVALPVVKDFIAKVREQAGGEAVARSLTPDQAFIKIVHDELVAIMGEQNAALDLRAQPPVVVLLAGLQGAGKTTTAAKLARRLQRDGKSVMLASADVYRPAAITQLGKLAEQLGVGFFASDPQASVKSIAEEALSEARVGQSDVLIFDTAGRLHVDAEMMAEIAGLHEVLKPVETLFVVDSMTGQDAVRAAEAFSATLPLTGVILTKTDGDARGGAALSVRQVTGAPIKFLGTGEKLDGLEAFHPERVASRILGMGDVLSLVEEVEQKVDQDKARKLARKLGSGKGFDLTDLRDQFSQMLDMGGLGQLMEKLPGQLAGKAPIPDDRQIRHQIALIDSMTPRERRFPRIIDGSRKRRISAGAGRPPQELNRLLKQHKQMQKMMKKMKGGGMAKMMRSLKGRLPPGMGG